MKTEASDPKSSAQAMPHKGPAPSPLRLAILLGVLGVFAGALLYDWVIAPPRVKAAYDKLHETALKHNELSVKSDPKKSGEKEGGNSEDNKIGGMLYHEDIQKIIGMPPTKIEKTDLYTIEHYCWWGWIPRNRNYITVLYVGNPDKPHYSTHYANEMPEDDAIPGRVKSGTYVEEKSGAGAAPAGIPPAGMPGMGTPGMGASPMPGAGGGKGKGRPQGKQEKKSSEAAKTDEPKKAEVGEKKQEEPAAETDKNSK